MAYKKDQGRMARMTVFWSIAILVSYGGASLHTTLQGMGSLADPLGGLGRIPIIGVVPNLALVISCLVTLLGLWLLYRWEQKPKNADLLIETEQELRKVTWPTIDEAVDSSLVVAGTVVFLMTFMAGADWFLGRLARRFLLGG
jgi:preprotein translocase SecE subunit